MKESVRDTLIEYTMTYLLDQPDDLRKHAKNFFKRMKESRHTTIVYDNLQYIGPSLESMPSLTGRRQNVCGDSYDPNSETGRFVKPVHSKTKLERKRLNKVAKRTLLFNALDDEQMEDVINAMFKRKTKPGDVIIEQGEDGDNFYVIERGIFDVFVTKTPTGKPELISSYNNEGSFGELALLYNVPRAATVIAKTKGVIWALDRNTFRNLVVGSAQEKRDMYQRFINAMPIMSDLGSYEKLNLTEVLVSKSFSKGDVVFKQGDTADGMYFIRSGAVSLKFRNQMGIELDIDNVRTGEYFGELALILQIPRVLSAYAAKDTKLAFLDADSFKRFMGPCKDVMKRKIQLYNTRISQMIGSKELIIPSPSLSTVSSESFGPLVRHTTVYGESYDPKAPKKEFIKPVYPKTDEETKVLERVVKKTVVFHALDEEQMEDVTNAMFKIVTKPGDVIIQQGDNGDNFYVIEQGVFDTYIQQTPEEKPEHVLTYVNSGNFGEMSLLYDQPRGATVISETDGIIWALDRDTFQRIVVQSSSSRRENYEKFIETVAILSELSPSERLNLADFLEPKRFKKGEIIVQQGDIADGMYFVETGAVSVWMENKVGDRLQIDRIEPGGYFGELALITKGTRAATVYAEDDKTRTAFLDTDVFERFMGPCVDVMKENIKLYKQKILQVFGSEDFEIPELLSSSTLNSAPSLDPVASEQFTRHARRGVVFGESYDPRAHQEEYVKPVHPKTDEERDTLEKVARDTLIFTALDEEQLEDIINAMFKRETKPGDVIIQQGEEGDNFYVIEKGVFDVFMAKPVEEPEHIFSYEDSGNFGELSLLYNQPRAATVKAKTAGVIWALDRNTFRKLVMQSSHDRRELYEKFIKTVPILSELGPHEVLNIADALVPKRFKKGDLVIKEGDKADGMYFVEKGAVSVKVQNKGRGETEISYIQPGGYFGELALITEKTRMASVYVEEDNTKLAFLCLEAFERCMGPCIEVMKRNIDHYNEQMNNILARIERLESSPPSVSSSDSMIPRPRSRSRGITICAESYNPAADDDDFIKPVYTKTEDEHGILEKVAKETLLFRTLEEEQFSDVINAMFKRITKPGDVIIKQGDDGDYFYVIEHGIFDVFRETSDGETKYIFSYENSGSFGELSLLYNQPRAATVKAKTAGVIWALERKTFRKLVMRAAYHKREQYDEFMKTVPILSELGPEERLNLADVLESKKYKRGELVMKQGDEADGMYLVELGTVSVKVEDDVGNVREIERIERGGYFGEFALITKKPRVASVYVEEDNTKLAFLNVEAFERFLGPCMDVMKRNIRQYNEQMAIIFGQEFVASSPASSSSDSLPSLRRRVRRGVVCGDSYDPNAAKEDFVKPVHPKTNEERETLKKVAKKTLIFSALDEDQLKDIINAMFKKVTKPGDVIIQQGEEGDNFYVIEKGVYDVFMAEEPGEKPEHIFSYEDSGNFGELSLLYNQPRAATVKAKTAGVIWALDRSTFQKLVMQSSHQKRELYEQFIMTVPILSELGSEEVLNVADALTPKRFNKGDLVIKEGDEPDGMYFVEKGSVTVKVRNKKGVETEIECIKSGGYFGELALITDAIRVASVYADEDNTKLAFLDVSAFERCMGPCIEVMKRNIEHYNEQMQDILAKQELVSNLDAVSIVPSSSDSLPPVAGRARRGVVFGESYDQNSINEDFVKPIHPKTSEERKTLEKVAKEALIFSALDDEQLEDIINAMFKKETKPGDVIIEQGEEGDNFYVIEKGVYDVFMAKPGEKQKHIFSYEHSGNFGELALLYNQPRAATVKAKSEGVIWALDRATFRKIVVHSAQKKAELHKKFIETLPLLSELKPDEKAKITDILSTKTYKQGELVIKEGDKPDGMYFVKDGVVSVKMINHKGEEVEIGRLEQGGYFGELALLTKRNRKASVYAESPNTKLVFLDSEAFERYMGPCADIMKRNIDRYTLEIARMFGSETTLGI